MKNVPPPEVGQIVTRGRGEAVERVQSVQADGSITLLTLYWSKKFATVKTVADLAGYRLALPEDFERAKRIAVRWNEWMGWRGQPP